MRYLSTDNVLHVVLLIFLVLQSFVLTKLNGARHFVSVSIGRPPGNKLRFLVHAVSKRYYCLLWGGYVFAFMCFVCEWDNSKRCGRILMKCFSRWNVWLAKDDVAGDLDYDVDTGNLRGIFFRCGVCGVENVARYYCVVFWRTAEGRLCSWHLPALDSRSTDGKRPNSYYVPTGRRPTSRKAIAT